MMPLEAAWQQPEQVDRGGLKYDIAIIAFANEFFKATWRCSECREKGVYAPIGRTPEEANRLAHICIGVHHELIHRARLN